jgi:hypothetical protein
MADIYVMSSDGIVVTLPSAILDVSELLRNLVSDCGDQRPAAASNIPQLPFEASTLGTVADSLHLETIAFVFDETDLSLWKEGPL